MCPAWDDQSFVNVLWTNKPETQQTLYQWHLPSLYTLYACMNYSKIMHCFANETTFTEILRLMLADIKTNGQSNLTKGRIVATLLISENFPYVQRIFIIPHSWPLYKAVEIYVDLVIESRQSRHASCLETVLRQYFHVSVLTQSRHLCNLILALSRVSSCLMSRDCVLIVSLSATTKCLFCVETLVFFAVNTLCLNKKTPPTFFRVTRAGVVGF